MKWAVCLGVAWHPIIWGEIISEDGGSFEIKDDSGRINTWDPEYVKRFASAQEAEEYYNEKVEKEVDCC